MSETTKKEQQTDLLIETLAKGFEQMNQNSNDREAILLKQYDLDLKIQQKKNLKWKLGAYVATFALVILGYFMYQTIGLFEDAMTSMSSDMGKMSINMESMASDMSAMNGNIGTMAPDMASMAGDMKIMSTHITSIDENMGSMKNDMGQMNNAMSPLMSNMQKFVPGW